jgi:hypothetical protein
LDGFAGKGGKVQRSAFQPELSAFGASQFQQQLHDAVEPHDLLQSAGEHGFVLFGGLA